MVRKAILWDSTGTRSTEYPVKSPNIRRGDYDVFLSHKGEDSGLAEDLGRILSRQGLSVYLDVWDPKVDDDLTLETYLREIIRNTDHILAVITTQTALSWWVPFEIGVARETESGIASYVEAKSYRTLKLPSYLVNWSSFSTKDKLRQWASEVKRDPVRSTSPDRYDAIKSLESTGHIELVP